MMSYSEDIFQKDMIKTLREIRDELYRSNQIAEAADARNAKYIQEQREFMRGNKPLDEEKEAIKDVAKCVEEASKMQDCMRYIFGREVYSRHPKEIHLLRTFLERYPEPLKKEVITSWIITKPSENFDFYELYIVLKDFTKIRYVVYPSNDWALRVDTSWGGSDRYDT